MIRIKKIITAALLAIITITTGKAYASPTSNGRVLTIDMSQLEIIEHNNDTDIMSTIKGSNNTRTVTLWETLQAIEIAATDPRISMIYLKTDNSNIGAAGAEEFRIALNNFRKSGKKILAFIESPSTKSYYIASVADSLFITSNHGEGHLSGVSTSMFFLKDILDTLGVNVELIRHGKYKSAGEMYIKNQPSAENLEQTQEMINSMWNSFSDEICKSRAISKDTLNGLIDNLSINSEDDYITHSLADRKVSAEGMRKALCANTGCRKFSEISFVNLPDYIKYKVSRKTRGKDRIAIIYADGSIVDGNGMKNIAGDRFASIIASVRADSTIKGVIFRVNSPGGSVLASEKIKEEIDLMRKDKPVVASYGDYAASGGYLISNSCDKIFSDKVTLTGSIGVFGMAYDISKTAKNLLRVGTATVNSNKHGDLNGLMFRPYDSEEAAYMQTSVDEIYNSFVSTVAQGRKMSFSAVDNIAQGRVWTGADALSIGLVDQIGTLQDAVQYIYNLISPKVEKKTKIRVVEYPIKPKSLMDKFLPLLMGASVQPLTAPASTLSGTSFGRISSKAASVLSEFDPNAPVKIYARMPFFFSFEN